MKPGTGKRTLRGGKYFSLCLIADLEEPSYWKIPRAKYSKRKTLKTTEDPRLSKLRTYFQIREEKT